MNSEAERSSQGQVILAQRPSGIPRVEDFQYREGPVPSPQPGEFLCRTQWLSLDPYLRGVISGRHMGENPVQVGDVMPGATVATVVGLTAYAGMMRLATPRPGDTVVISAAAGPVGCVAGQIARIGGCHVVGIAGSDEKCQTVVDDFGFDCCINYRDSDLSDELAKACPDGVDIYFDNVGGETLEAVLRRLAVGARVVLCGLISQYNADEPPPGPNPAPIIIARAAVYGLVVYDHDDLEPEFLQRTSHWIRAGKLRYREDIAEGLEEAGAAFCRLMRGENLGKALVRLT